MGWILSSEACVTNITENQLNNWQALKSYYENHCGRSDLRNIYMNALIERAKWTKETNTFTDNVFYIKWPNCFPLKLVVVRTEEVLSGKDMVVCDTKIRT